MNSVHVLALPYSKKIDERLLHILCQTGQNDV